MFGRPMQSPKTAQVIDPGMDELWYGVPTDDGQQLWGSMPAESFGGFDMPAAAPTRVRRPSPYMPAQSPVGDIDLAAFGFGGAPQPQYQQAAYQGQPPMDPNLGLGSPEIVAAARANLLAELSRNGQRSADRDRMLRQGMARRGVSRMISNVGIPLAQGMMGGTTPHAGLSQMRKDLLSELDTDQQSRDAAIKDGMTELKGMADLIDRFDPETIKNVREQAKSQNNYYNSMANVYRAGKYGQQVDNTATYRAGQLDLKRADIKRAALMNAAQMQNIESQIATRAARGEIDTGKLAIAKQMLQVAKDRLAQGAQQVAINRDKAEWGAYNDNVRTLMMNAAKEAGIDAKQLEKAYEVNSKGDQKYPGLADSLGIGSDDEEESGGTSDWLGGLMNGIGAIFGGGNVTAPQATPALAPVTGIKKLTDPAKAKQYLLKAGGDKDKAREMARKDGYSF